MVAQAPTTPLPTLSRPDKLRLTLYFSLGQSVEALALELLDIHRDHQSRLKTNNSEPATFLEALTTENTALASFHSGLGTRDSALSSPPDSALGTRHSALPPDAYDLAAWTLSDPIAPHIAYRRSEHLEQRKQRALQELDTILADAASSPVEKRRAATTMLRMLATQLTRNRAAPPSPAPGGRAVLRGGEGSVSTPPTHSPSRETLPTSRITHDPDSSSSGPSAASSPHSQLPTPHSPPPPPAILNLSPAGAGFRSSSVNPQARPHPNLTPQDLITLAVVAVKNPTDQLTRDTLEHFLTPQATINHEPVLNLESQLTPLAPKLKVVQIFRDSRVKEDPGPPQTRTSDSWLIQPGRSNGYRITLTRADSGPWLISAIDPVNNTS